MPPRGVYKAKQEEKKKKQVAKSSPQNSFADRLGRSPTRDPRDNQDQPSGTSAVQRIISRADKINNAVKTTSAKAKMSPPISKPKSPTKFTISGGLIKGGTIYKDEITGSTLAGKETRINAITDPQSVRVQDSRAVKTGGPKGFSRKGSLIDMTPDTAGPKGFTRKGLTPFQQEQVGIVNRLDNPQETKLDLVTKDPIQPTLLTDLRKKRKRNLGGGNFWSQMIRSLLG